MYVVRNTFTPEYDVRRNWSAWIGGDWATEQEALESLAEDSPLWEKYCERFRDRSYEEIVAKVVEAEGFDVRFNEAFGRWQHVHHEGLSCYRLEAENEAEAFAEAEAGEWPWHGFGDTTSGTVRWVGAVPGKEDLHIFECDEAWAEEID